MASILTSRQYSALESNSKFVVNEFVGVLWTSYTGGVKGLPRNNLIVFAQVMREMNNNLFVLNFTSDGYVKHCSLTKMSKLGADDQLLAKKEMED